MIFKVFLQQKEEKEEEEAFLLVLRLHFLSSGLKNNRAFGEELGLVFKRY